MLFFFYGMVKAILGNARAPLTWSLSLRQACMSNSSTTRAVSESHRRHRTISQLKGNPSCATPPGLEPGIPWFVVRCLIHWATGPDAIRPRGRSHASTTPYPQQKTLLACTVLWALLFKDRKKRNDVQQHCKREHLPLPVGVGDVRTQQHSYRRSVLYQIGKSCNVVFPSA